MRRHALLIALLAAAALAGCVGDDPDRIDAVLDTDPARVADQCLPEPEPAACLGAHTTAVLRELGPAPAIGLLEGLSAQARTSAFAHAVAHDLGHAMLLREGNVSAAAALCPITMGSGCLHGVVEAYLAHAGPDADLAHVCDLSGHAALHKVHQCQHGVGHGLRMALPDPIQAAGRCTSLPDFDARANCASGVFMENVVGTRDPQRLRPDEPGYPCSALDRVDLAVGCWQMQPSLVVASTANLTQAAEVCALAGPLHYACASGFGQVAASNERLTGTPLQATCELALNQSAGESCLAGAVADVVTQAADIRPGLARCLQVVEAVQGVCYRAVGNVHVALVADPAARELACASVPQAHRAECVDGMRAAMAAQEPASP